HERDYACRHWGEMLRAIYAQQRNAEKYIELASRTELTQADCEAVAAIYQSKRKLADTLAWVERGLKIGKPHAFESSAGVKLGEMRRALLVKLGRGGAAVE